MQKDDQLAVNKAVVRRWIEARNASDLEAALALWTEERHVWLRERFAAFSTAFPDIHITVEEIIAEGDKVVLRFTLRGTHLGVWAGLAATGRKVTWAVTDIYTLKDGKLAGLVRAAPDLKALLSANG